MDLLLVQLDDFKSRRALANPVPVDSTDEAHDVICRSRRTKDAAAILRQLGTPLLIHQPSYSMLNRWIEPDLLKVLGDEGIGCIVFSPLAQGLLTDRYLAGVPAGSRASHPGSFSADLLTEQLLAKVRALNQIAIRRGQTLAQMALPFLGL